MSTWVWIDGTLTPAAEARIGATDRGLLVGDGVFETCQVIDGTPFALTRHLARLRRSAEIVDLALPWGDSHIRSACAKTVGAALVDAAGDGTVGRLRITVTAGSGPLGPARTGIVPTLLVAAGPAPAWGPTSDVVTVPWRVNEHSPAVGAKTISYVDHVLALAEAQRRGADEAVLANSSGVLAEGTGSNVFLVVDGVLCTPSLSTGCLAGVTRALVCEGTEVVERHDLTLHDLQAATEAFLTSSTREVHPIAHIDGRELAPVPGPHTAAATAALRAVKDRTIDP